MTSKLLFELTWRDFTEKYSGSILGAAWSFLWPLVNILIYVMIFSKIMSARMPDRGVNVPGGYAAYLISGIIPWTVFSITVTRASTVFIDKKSIISKIKISLPTLPLHIVLSESVTFIIAMTFFIAYLIMVKSTFTKAIVFLPFIFIVQQIFAYALGFLIAIFDVFIRDLKEATAIMMQIWFWFTPIVYFPEILPPLARKLIHYNPAYLFITSYHDILIFAKPPHFFDLFYLAIEAHVILALAYIFFKCLEKDIRDFI